MIKFIEYAAIDHSILFNKGTPLCIEWATSPNYNSLYEVSPSYPLQRLQSLTHVNPPLDNF